MSPTNQQIPENHVITRLYPAVSESRFATYLTAAGHDPDRALKLYMWNAQIGEAFHVPIQAVEVGLRNRINGGLTAVFGVQWWQEESFLQVADPERLGDLEMVKIRIRNRKLDLNTGQVVAGLSFGFWIGMMQPRYNPPLWGGQLRTVFPNLPSNRSRKSIAEASALTGVLRNRIWHHEPIFKRDLMKDYSTIAQLLLWICPDKADWIKPYCRVPALLREKP